MKKWQTVISILLIFALGTAVGAYGSRAIFKKRVSRALRSEVTPGIKVIQGMVGRLDLSDSQQAAINAILDENNEEWEAIRQEYEPKIKELFETVIEKTKKELTPQQREEVEKMSAMVKRRLPPRSSFRPRSSGPPEGATPPDSSLPPRSSTPPESSGPPAMNQPYAPKTESDRVAEILDGLQVDPEKTEVVRTLIEADLQNQEAMRETFEISQETAEAEFLDRLEDARLATEKKLLNFLTAEQVDAYRKLMNPEEPLPDEFIFDVPGNTMEPSSFLQEEPPAAVGKTSGKTKGHRSI